MDKIQGTITYINGPVIKADNMEMFKNERNGYSRRKKTYRRSYIY